MIRTKKLIHGRTTRYCLPNRHILLLSSKSFFSLRKVHENKKKLAVTSRIQVSDVGWFRIIMIHTKKLIHGRTTRFCLSNRLFFCTFLKVLLSLRIVRQNKKKLAITSRIQVSDVGWFRIIMIHTKKLNQYRTIMFCHPNRPTLFTILKMLFSLRTLHRN